MSILYDGDYVGVLELEADNGEAGQGIRVDKKFDEDGLITLLIYDEVLTGNIMTRLNPRSIRELIKVLREALPYD